MSWPGWEYVLVTNEARHSLVTDLPEGTRTITRYDVVRCEAATLAEAVRGRFTFATPDSRGSCFIFKGSDRRRAVSWTG